jgi:hypothetical protein
MGEALWGNEYSHDQSKDYEIKAYFIRETAPN